MQQALQRRRSRVHWDRRHRSCPQQLSDRLAVVRIQRAEAAGVRGAQIEERSEQRARLFRSEALRCDCGGVAYSSAAGRDTTGCSEPEPASLLDKVAGSTGALPACMHKSGMSGRLKGALWTGVPATRSGAATTRSSHCESTGARAQGGQACMKYP